MISKKSENEENKHHRRTAKEIAKEEMCPYPYCGKYYGSEGSLNLHMKLKHNGGNKTDREKLAKGILMAFINSKPLPEISINLPPGAIEEECKKMNLELGSEKLREIHFIWERNLDENQK